MEMSATGNVLQVTASRIPMEDQSCCIRYRLPAVVDALLPALFHDGVTMISPLPDSAAATNASVCIVEACRPGMYHASSFLGSTELEVNFVGSMRQVRASMEDFDLRIRALGLGQVRHPELRASVSAR
jgi:hypothetical protein